MKGAQEGSQDAPEMGSPYTDYHENCGRGACSQKHLLKYCKVTCEKG